MHIQLQTFVLRSVVVLLVIFSFEEFIYGRMGLGGVGYLVAKTLSELYLYALLGVIFLWRAQSGAIYQYRPTVFDAAIVTFILLALISTLMNGGGLAQGLLNLRTMLRYVAIYYIITLSAWGVTEWQLKRFMKLIILVALVQVIVSILQNIGGDSFIERYFSPVMTTAAVGGVSISLGGMGQKMGAAIGTFGKTPALSLFLLIAAVVTVVHFTLSDVLMRRKWLFFYLAIVLAIFMTYKRGPLLLALFAPVLVAWLSQKKKLVRKYFLLAGILGPIFLGLLLAVQPTEYVREKEVEVSPLQSLSQLFTEDYWNRTSASSRGWVIVEIGSEAIASFKPIGYGADEERARVLLAQKGGTFSKLVGWGALDDVYVIAALVYYGPIGTLLLLAAFSYIYRESRFIAKNGDGELQVIAISLCALLILTFFASFLVRTLEFRSFAFTLWVFSGIVVVAAKKARREIRSFPRYPRVNHVLPAV